MAVIWSGGVHELLRSNLWISMSMIFRCVELVFVGVEAPRGHKRNYLYIFPGFQEHIYHMPIIVTHRLNLGVLNM